MKNKLFLVTLFIQFFYYTSLYSQISRIWEYNFNPPDNYVSAGNAIAHLNDGMTVTGGYFDNTNNSYRHNILVLMDSAGSPVFTDTSTLGFGIIRILSTGDKAYALGSLQNDSNTARNILVAKIDPALPSVDFFVPDSNPSIYYDPLDFAFSSSGHLLIGERMDNFPQVHLLMMCMDTSGQVLWQTVDSTFEIKYDLKIVPDLSGGCYVSGSGRDLSTSEDFIFISRFDSIGQRDWFIRQNSPSLFFADFLDLIRDDDGMLWMSGVVMDSSGQVGILSKLDTAGNLIHSRQVLPYPYQQLLSSGNRLFGAAVPQNGTDVFTLDKMDTAGAVIQNASFQLSGYFISVLYNIRLTADGMLTAIGEVFVLSFPKSDLFFAVYDTSFTLAGYDIYDSLNLLGESGRSMAEGPLNELYVCGRINYENGLETSNLGIIKYHYPVLTNISLPGFKQVLEAFPNPSTGECQLQFSPAGEHCSINVLSIEGKTIKTYKPKPGETSTFFSLPAGLYYVQLLDGLKQAITILTVID